MSCYVRRVSRVPGISEDPMHVHLQRSVWEPGVIHASEVGAGQGSLLGGGGIFAEGW